MNSIAKINIKGEQFALIPWEDYEDLADIAAYNDFQRKLAAGEEEFFPSELLDKILDDRENPVKVYREYRGKSVDEACAATGISKDYWKKLEKGVAVGSVATLKKIAKFLNVTMEMLTPCDD